MSDRWAEDMPQRTQRGATPRRACRTTVGPKVGDTGATNAQCLRLAVARMSRLSAEHLCVPSSPILRRNEGEVTRPIADVLSTPGPGMPG